jgi:hypothetical protein
MHTTRSIRHCLVPIQALIALALTLLVTACQQQPASGESAGIEGMRSIQNAGIEQALVNPDANLTAYSSLLIGDLQFSRLEVTDPGRHDARYREFALSDDDKAQLSSLYRQQVEKRLMRDGRFAVTTQPGRGTLRVVTELLRLEPTAPREQDARTPGSARDRTYTRGAGSLTLESQLFDSVSGKRVAILRDKLTDNDMIWWPNNSVTNQAALRRAFSRWAATLQQQLKQAQMATP